MIYAMSDLHGCYEKYEKMLEKIGFCGDDTLYVLGDCIDRGEDGIKILLDMMTRRNIVPMLGNHEYMAYKVLSKLQDDDFGDVAYETMLDMLNWHSNGGDVTQEAFAALPYAKRKKLLEYIESFDVYTELTVGEREFILVHAGLGNFRPDKLSEEYTLEELVWDRADYGKKYFEDKFLVTGHTHTLLIDSNYKGKIYRKNNHIAIDCGAVFGENLGCICLDTLEEFYV